MSLNIIEQEFKWNGGFEVRRQTDTIVLHHAAAKNANVQDIHNWHLSQGWAGIGYHFYIRKDGSVFRGRPEDVVGAHALGHNSDSIGICFEGNFEIEEMAELQIRAGRELISFIKSKYIIKEILEHKEVNSTACPGTNFPFIEITSPAIDEEDNMIRYEKLSDIPNNNGFRDIIEILMNAKIINGDGSDQEGNNDVIDLSLDQVRCLIFVYRGGGFDRKLIDEGLKPVVEKSDK